MSPRVAVIGLGAAGITTTKNLLEVGLDVQAYDKHDRLGGIWAYTADPTRLSAIKSTHANLSKHLQSFTDFPMFEDAPEYVSAQTMADYMAAYSAHFGLGPHIRLRTEVCRISPEHAGDPLTRWVVRVKDLESGTTTSETFDKVVMASGAYQTPRYPVIQGVKEWPHMIVHSKAYKSATPFHGQRVVVMGTGNTALDIACELLAHASVVYWSNRSGNRVFPRQEPPIDTNVTFGMAWTAARTKAASKEGPSAGKEQLGPLGDQVFHASWPDYDLVKLRLLPAPTAEQINAAVNSEFVPALASGRIKGIGEIARIGDGFVETTSGETYRCDRIITATGGQFDYSALADEASPIAQDHSLFDNATFAEGLKIPRLYQGLFHPRYSATLAFVGPTALLSYAITGNYDVAAMAIAQVFADRYHLPPMQEMEEWCEKMYERNAGYAQTHRPNKVRVQGWELEQFLCKVTGNRMVEMLGQGEEEPALFRQDKELWDLVMEGRWTPYVYRLFDGRQGGRQRWPQAREAILWANGKGNAPSGVPRLARTSAGER